MTKKHFVHADASDLFWAALLTHYDEKELHEAPVTQWHDPLPFLSGPLSSTQDYWTKIEKVAFEIVQTFRNVSPLFECDGTTTFLTDHRNLLFTFHPSALDSFLGCHKIMIVILWKIFLSTFTYSIRNIVGKDNLMSEMVSRCLRVYRGHPVEIRRLRDVPSPWLVIVAPQNDSTFWPKRGNLISIQRSARNRQRLKQKAKTISVSGGKKSSVGPWWRQYYAAKTSHYFARWHIRASWWWINPRIVKFPFRMAVHS